VQQESVHFVLRYKKLDAGKFSLPRPTRAGDQHVVVSDAIFDAIFKGVPTTPRSAPRRRIH
jgi:transposase